MANTHRNEYNFAKRGCEQDKLLMTIGIFSLGLFVGYKMGAKTIVVWR